MKKIIHHKYLSSFWWHKIVLTSYLSYKGKLSIGSCFPITNQEREINYQLKISFKKMWYKCIQLSAPIPISQKKLWLEAKYLDFIFKLDYTKGILLESFTNLILKYHLLHFPTFKLRCEVIKQHGKYMTEDMNNIDRNYSQCLRKTESFSQLLDYLGPVPFY